MHPFQCWSPVCGTSTGQKRLSDPVELEIWTAISHPMWVLGTEARSPERALGTPCLLSHLSRTSILYSGQVRSLCIPGRRVLPDSATHVSSLQLQTTKGQESASVLKTRLDIASLFANWEGEGWPEQVVAVQSRACSHKQAVRLWRRQWVGAELMAT